MRRVRASLILAAFAFAIAAPLFAAAPACAMTCCKHPKQCPLPRPSCPSISRDAESANANATSAPAQPVVHAAPAVVEIAVAAVPRPISSDEMPPVPERPLYIFDSVFRI